MSKSMSRRGALMTLGKLAVALAAGNLSARRAEAQSLGDLAALVPLPPGSTLPPIRFFTAGGEALTLSRYRGKGIVLNLWAPWCGPCVAEMPTLDTLATRVKAEDVVVLPVATQGGSAASIAAFYRSHGITHLPLLLDTAGAIPAAWNLTGIPTTVIFDRGGAPRARLVGAADWGTTAAIARIRAFIGPDLARSATVRL